MSGPELMGVVLFFVTVSGVLWGIWWRIEGKVEKAKADALATATTAAGLAAQARQELQDHKLHCAETYITKHGLRDVKEELMEVLQGVKGSIDHLGGRIDGLYIPTTPRARAAK